MHKPYQKALFIFRRDLRLEDNTGLLFALEKAKEVILSFIFTPDQIENNPYRSDYCLQFMVESLEDLEKAILAKKGRLYLFQGKPEEVILKCIEKLHVDAVIVNRDYTPYSIKRDLKIETLCKKSKISFHSFDDALLNPPEQTLKKDGKPYTIFTPFYKNAIKSTIQEPVANHYSHYYSDPIPFSCKKTIYDKILPKRHLKPSGGRTAGLAILKTIEIFSHYTVLKNVPSELGTTHLSAHLKFTTCSPREVYFAIVEKLGPLSELIRSLYWRDFFSGVAFHFPEVFLSAFHSKFDQLTWSNDKETFKKWCEGNTGFPIIDAGMREMNQTGFMHNRIRMIVASFLVKDLHIDWRWGEKYFAKTLIDYDPAVNNGNWQWAASTGCDAQPYFRIFNPWMQSLKFDPSCIYIKRWIPELTSLPSSVIHKWHLEKHWTSCLSYPTPIVDHTKESKIAIASYKTIAQKKLKNYNRM